jgi:hypothetical protein
MDVLEELLQVRLQKTVSVRCIHGFERILTNLSIGIDAIVC